MQKLKIVDFFAPIPSPPASFLYTAIWVCYLTHSWQLLRCTAGGVVLAVRKAGEDLGVPRRADHQVRHARRGDRQRVAELIHATETN